jgi:arylsulfatase A-like enzyme
MQAIRESYGTDRLSAGDWTEIVATYYGMVSRIDHHFGRIEDAVAKTGSAERTATVFFTDSCVADQGNVQEVEIEFKPR